MKVLVVIPARGGSKGLPNKNINLLNGIPLITYTIRCARDLFHDSDICVSTDSNQIIEIVKNENLDIPFVRPSELAEDTSSTRDVILHALSHYESMNIFYDTIIILQPTSPLRESIDIKNALELYYNNLDMVVSVYEPDLNPYYSIFEEDDKGYLVQSKPSSYTRRQDLPKVFAYNGAIYVINVESLKNREINKFDKIVKYIMPQERSVDIDTKLDWKIAELILNNKN
jgi:N-acylneuraminate cytidylyltransferase